MADTDEFSGTTTVITLADTDYVRALNNAGTPSEKILWSLLQTQIRSLVNVTDYVNGSQQVRTSATFTKTSDTALANIPGLSVTLATGGHYRISARLLYTANASYGIKATLSGTVVPSYIVFEGWATYANNVAGVVQATALGTVVCAINVATGQITIEGYIDVATGGTLTVQFAQNTSGGTGSVVLVGSTLFVDRMN